MQAEHDPPRISQRVAIPIRMQHVLAGDYVLRRDRVNRVNELIPIQKVRHIE